MCMSVCEHVPASTRVYIVEVRSMAPPGARVRSICGVPDVGAGN